MQTNRLLGRKVKRNRKWVGFRVRVRLGIYSLRFRVRVWVWFMIRVREG